MQCNRPGLCDFEDATAQAQCIAQCEAIPGWLKRSPEPLSSSFVRYIPGYCIISSWRH